jgi:uncharacterized protein (DUF1778 family)
MWVRKEPLDSDIHCLYNLTMAGAKTQRLNLRIEQEDEALFKRAAEVQRESLTQFLVESGRERAQRLLADRTSFHLDPEAWQELVAAMDRPAKARPELAKLFSQPRPE